uniref:NB-ARC domain-containing protein n=2 Tax=Cucumis sativus TaxID=3659 RepID=A0A0A0LF99_CUCSA
MACCIYEQAENILIELKKFPMYLRRMQYTMLSLKTILKDAEKEEYRHCLNDWLQKLQSVFLQIEELLYESNREVKKQEATGKWVFLPSFNFSQIDQTKKMMKLCDDLDEIASHMYGFNLTNMETTHSFLSATEVSTRLMKPSWQLLYSLTNAPKVFQDKRYHNFLDHFKKSTHGLFHIVGEPGIGKTTLAKFFYNNLVNTFPSRLWICVKEEFDPQRLIKEMLSFSHCQVTCDNLTEKQLCFAVQQFLRDKKFLIVFQDISIKNLGNCSIFKSLLGMGNRGSKIIVTTQNEKIADAVGLKKLYKNESQVVPSPEATKPSDVNKDNMKHQTIFKVERLSKENSLSLFKVHAFTETQEAQIPNLTKIQEVIEQKCHGVPLAIKCLGGLLSKTSIAEWNGVIDKLWEHEEEEDGNKSILPTLRLCYDQMPSHLQRCFLYCSQLKKDRILSSNDVIQLWIASDLLPKENYLSLEKIGENYFKELCSRCFLQELEEYGFGYWFKLHPLIEKLARLLTQKQVFEVTKTQSIAFTIRDKVPPSAFLANACIDKFKYLRLLHLGNANLQGIPSAVENLVQLRYLDLQGNKKIKRLPNSIFKLKNLQTLILASCSALKELPNDIRQLTNLRYLWVTANNLRLHKNGVGTMTSLRFLAIGGCQNLQDLFKKPSCLVRLETLMIYDCKTLKSLPNEIGSLISLKNLVIWSCKKLTLTLKGVEFRLQRFTIRELPIVKKLPEWTQRFTETLRVLEIIDCPIEWNDDVLKSYKSLERFSIHGAVRTKNQIGGYNIDYRNFVRSRKVKKEVKTCVYY